MGRLAVLSLRDRERRSRLPGMGRPRPGGRHARAGLNSRTPGFGASILLARLCLPSTFGEVSASVTQVWKEGMTVCTSHPHRPSNSWSGCRPHPLVTGRDDLICRGWGRPRPGGPHAIPGLYSRTPGFGGKHPLGEALPPFHHRGCFCQCDPSLDGRWDSVYLPP